MNKDNRNYRVCNFKERLREHGMRLTPQRFAIFRILKKTNSHPSAESIFRRIKRMFPATSRATVYSTLRCLQKGGFIQELRMVDGVRRFDGRARPHFHLICINCNKIDDIEIEPDISLLKSFIVRKTGYKLLQDFLSFNGYCPRCKKKIDNIKK